MLDNKSSILLPQSRYWLSGSVYFSSLFLFFSFSFLLFLPLLLCQLYVPFLYFALCWLCPFVITVCSFLFSLLFCQIATMLLCPFSSIYMVDLHVRNEYQLMCGYTGCYRASLIVGWSCIKYIAMTTTLSKVHLFIWQHMMACGSLNAPWVVWIVENQSRVTWGSAGCNRASLIVGWLCIKYIAMTTTLSKVCRFLWQPVMKCGSFNAPWLVLIVQNRSQVTWGSVEYKQASLIMW